MTTVTNASVVFKDKNGNVGTVKGASANDITKISNAISDVAQVVDPTSHLPIQATTSSVGVVQLADSAAVSAGTSGRVVDAAQLKDAIEHVTPAGNLMTLDTAQTVTAVKTFSSLPESSVAPTTNNQLVNKKYVDDHTPTGVVDLTSAQTISGLKTFSTLPQSSVAPSTGNDLVNKTYVDGQVAVDSTYTEPAVSKGILSPATNRLTPPSTAQELAIPQSHFPGEIIISTVPVTDANVHLADGALLDGAGSYADFVDVIAALHDADPTNPIFTDETTWQSTVTTYGECGKYVYNATANTVRIPKLTTFVQATSTASELGALVEAGAPNITGGINNFSVDVTRSMLGAFEDKTTGGFSYGFLSGTSESPFGMVTFDASKSNSIYGNANTIQPQAIKYYFYIVVGTISKTDIQIDIDNVLSDLNLKADKDFSNVTAPTQAFKDMSIRWGMPDYSAPVSLLGLSTYIAPSDGVFMAWTNATGWREISINGLQIARYTVDSSCTVPMRKGDILTSDAGLYGAAYFFPFLGAE